MKKLFSPNLQFFFQKIRCANHGPFVNVKKKLQKYQDSEQAKVGRKPHCAVSYAPVSSVAVRFIIVSARDTPRIYRKVSLIYP